MDDTGATAWRRQSAADRSPRRRRLVAWLPFAVALGFVAVAAIGVLEPAHTGPLTVERQPAPDFRLALYTGGHLSLADLRGKTVVVNFWWSGCEPCRQEAATLERAWRRWRGHGVVFVGIDEQDSTSQAEAYLRAYSVTYPNGPDPDDIDIAYHTTGQPETFVISARGIVERHYTESIQDERLLDRFIDEVRV